MEEKKRLFFGSAVHAPWPEHFPSGRLIREEMRHMTLAFLGSCNWLRMQQILLSLPLPCLKVGSVGLFDQLLFLPPHHPHVVAYHGSWLEEMTLFDNTLTQLRNFLHENNLQTDTRPFLPHVTIARDPFILHDWKKHFSAFPFYTASFHLYESLGHSQYHSLWHFPIAPPFEEISHTADIAYLVRGTNLRTLYDHARVALAFTFPPLLAFFNEPPPLATLVDVIIALNELVTHADHTIGVPFKAVSFHDQMEEKNGVMEWEMIIDV